MICNDMQWLEQEHLLGFHWSLATAFAHTHTQFRRMPGVSEIRIFHHDCHALSDCFIDIFHCMFHHISIYIICDLIYDITC